MATPRTQPYLFASFSSADIEVADLFTAELASLDVAVWAAHRNLQPGEVWSEAIGAAVAGASGALALISEETLRSALMQRELANVMRAQRRVFVVTIGSVNPAGLASLVGPHARLSVPVNPSSIEVHRACLAIASALHADADWHTGSRLFDQTATESIASTIAADLDGSDQQPGPSAAEFNAVFVVHGHDHAFLDEVVVFLRSLGVEPIVLTRLGTDDPSLFQRFFRYGQKARFAVALISADDMGVSCAQYATEGVGERALQYRARQNVVLELGFFFGRLGWQSVFILQKQPPRVYPNFERPSDLDGVVFNIRDEQGRWKEQLAARLRAANVVSDS